MLSLSPIQMWYFTVFFHSYRLLESNPRTTLFTISCGPPNYVSLKRSGLARPQAERERKREREREIERERERERDDS